MLSKLDKKLLKVLPMTSYEIEYLQYQPREKKERYIKIYREKIRELTRIENLTSSYFA